MITAEFTADFTDFSAALKDAIKDLRDLSAASKDAAKVADDSFKTMTSSGVSTGQTMTSIGQEALNLGKAVGIGFGVKEVIDFGREVIAAAAAIEKLHAQTGISAEDLQRMEAAGAGVGVSLDSMTDGATRLTASLGKGDKGTATALADLNIDLEKFKAMGAAEQMATLAEAVQKVHDPLRLAADLQAIYGKGWAEQLPVLQKGFKDTGADTLVWSADTVKALDSASNAASGWWTYAQKVFGVQMANLLTNTSEAMRVLESDFKAMLANTDKLGPPKGLVPLRDGIVDVSGAVDLLNAGLEDQEAQIKANIEAEKQYASDVKALNADEQKAQIAYSDLLSRLHREALEHYEEEAAARKKQTATINAAVVDGNTQIMAAAATLHDYEMKASMDTTTYQIMKIWEKAEEEIKAFKGTEQQAATHADLVYSIAEQEAKGITDVMASAVEQMVGMASAGLDATTAKATAAVNQMYSMAGGSQMSATDYDEYYKTAAGQQDIIRNKGKRYYAGELMPRAGGGPVSAGSPYLVGERGPELFVPSRSGSIVPSGTTNNFHITQPLGTPAAIARAVEDAMNSALRNSGVRLPSGA